MDKVKDLIIGACSNYTYDDLKYWINSIRRSGFDGDVVLTGTNLKKDTIQALTKEGVGLELYGTMNKDGDIEAPRSNAPHVERFFYIWNYLDKTPNQYGHVITTDTRDVIFQQNPSNWLVSNLGYNTLVASSEGLKYKDEPWGEANFDMTFGPYFSKQIENRLIYNVGVIAGETKAVKGLMMMIFQMSINRPIPIVDQAVYNFLLNYPPYEDLVRFTRNTDGWAIQLGTTIKAIEAGSGDLGAIARNDPKRMKKYKMDYLDVQPKFDEHRVINPNTDEDFVVVHQYDRIPELKKKVQEFYGD